jgi:hypothetical protein
MWCGGHNDMSTEDARASHRAREEDGVSPRGSRNGKGGDAAGVAASRGGSDEFLEHGKREEGGGTSRTKKNEKWRLEMVLTEEWWAVVLSR